MSRDLTLAMRLYADTARFVGGLTNGRRGVDSFVNQSKQKISELRSAFGSLEGKLAGLGVSIGGMAVAIQSAHLDKDLIRIGQTAAMSRDETMRLRKELFSMAKETGSSIDELKTGFDVAVQAGLNFKEALPVTDAVNKAMAVTGARAEQLTSALGSAATAFQFDLAKPGQALMLLDQMTAAGRMGNAELQNLADIFAKVAVNANTAGLGFEQTLGFIEGLSKIERNPERLSTLGFSTLRIFTERGYMAAAAKATGVRFLDAKRERRDPLAILEDMRKKFRELKNEGDRIDFIDRAFGKTDQDTRKGLMTLFTGSVLDDVRRFSRETKNAGGLLKRDMTAAIHNAVDQTGRLKAGLREAADSFAQPVNEAITNFISFMMADKKDLGLGLSGKDVAIGGLEIAGGSLALAALFGAVLGKGKAGGGLAADAAKGLGLGKNIAVGHALSQLGIQSVYVVNMPDGGIGGSGGISVPGMPLPGGKAAGAGAKVLRDARLLRGLWMTDIAGLGAGAMATSAAMVGAAGLGGYALGTGIFKLLENTKFADDLGGTIATIMARFGSDEALKALDQRLSGKLDLNIKVDSEGRATVSPSGPVMLEPPTRTNPAATGRMLWGG